MARVLIVVPPLAGHVAPLAGVAGRLAARGHDVCWAGSPRVVRSVAGTGAAVWPAGPDPDGALPGRPAGLRAFAALRHLWEGFLVPLADNMLPEVDRAVRSWRPDVVLADQQAFAAPLAALRHGLPWVTSASTSAELTDPFRAYPRIAGWIDGLQRRLLDDAGLPSGDPVPDLRRSPHLTVCYSVAELAGTPSPGGPVAMVGPCLEARAERPGFPWELLDPARSLVLVSAGTANEETAPRFLRACRDGLAGLPDVQPVVVDPLAPAVREPGPAREIVLPWVPQLRLLRRAAAAVGHAGHNTVVEALHAEVPLVLAPIRDDQPVVAAQVRDAGAGVLLRFDRAGPDDVATAVRTVLDVPGHAAAARRIGRALARAGGSAAAAEAVERIAAGTPAAGTVAATGRTDAPDARDVQDAAAESAASR